MLPKSAAPITAVALLTAACAPSEPVQVFLEITTDLDCSSLRSVAIDLVDGTGTQSQVASTDTCANGRVGSLVFLPDRKDSSSSTGGEIIDAFDIIVVAGVEIATAECEANGYTGCIVARRHVAFRSGTTVVPIELRADCIGIACSPSTTCVSAGECASSSNNND